MSTIYDAIVVGGGPCGSIAALTLAREGFRAVVLDRLTFPHFHIGESFLPRNLGLIRELGLAEQLAALPQVEKRGGSLVSGHGRDEIAFWFDNGLAPGETVAFNIERAPFDRMLLDAAKAAGAEVREGTPVKEILRLADGDVAVRVDGAAGGNGEEEIRGRWLIDASGQGAVVGRHLGTREVLPDLRKVAYYGHFENVWRAEMPEGGFPIIVMCQEGWFWLIPLDEHRTSIGIVLGADFARSTGVPPTACWPGPSAAARWCASAPRTPSSPSAPTSQPTSATAARPMPALAISWPVTPPPSSTRSSRPASAWA